MLLLLTEIIEIQHGSIFNFW